MNKRELRELLTDLGKDAAQLLRQRPAPAHEVMRAFCDAMEMRTGRYIDLVFRPFPPAVPVSGLRLDLVDHTMIVVEENTPPESQLVILGHELLHEAKGDCQHGIAGIPAAARALAEPNEADIQAAAEAILASERVPLDAMRAVAARAESSSDAETAAETFGLWFGLEVRPWIEGLPYVQRFTTAATIEGRLHLSLGRRDGLLG